MDPKATFIVAKEAKKFFGVDTKKIVAKVKRESVTKSVTKSPRKTKKAA